MGETSLCVNVKSAEVLEKKFEDAQRKDNRKMPLGVVEGLALGGTVGAEVTRGHSVFSTPFVPDESPAPLPGSCGLQLWALVELYSFVFSVLPQVTLPLQVSWLFPKHTMHFLPRDRLTQLTLKRNGLKDTLSISQTLLIASQAAPRPRDSGRPESYL